MGLPQRGTDSAVAHLPQNGHKTEKLAAKKTQPGCRNAGCESKVWNYDQFQR
jgi:hypothetical protein